MAVDAGGRLNTAKLERELVDALHEDERRTKTDAMKKRAIHTAGSYDEFRHMVSCAQLTPVSRKELEALSDPKRGWQGRSGVASSVRPPGRQPKSSGDGHAWGEARPHPAVGAAGGKGKKGGRGPAQGPPKKLPATQTEFERDWLRRCRSDKDQQSYLALVEPKRLAKLFAADMPPNLLGGVLGVLARGFEGTSKCPPPPSDGGAAEPGVGGGAPNTGGAAPAQEDEALGKDGSGGGLLTSGGGGGVGAAAPASEPPAAAATAADTGGSSRQAQAEGEDMGESNSRPRAKPADTFPHAKPVKAGSGGVGAAEECVAWLEALACTGRFGLNVGFMSDAEVGEVCRLLDGLEQQLLTGQTTRLSAGEGEGEEEEEEEDCTLGNGPVEQASPRLADRGGASSGRPPSGPIDPAGSGAASRDEGGVSPATAHGAASQDTATVAVAAAVTATAREDQWSGRLMELRKAFGLVRS